MSDDVERQYKLVEVQKILGVSRATLKRWIYDGKMKAVKIGAHWRVSESEVRRFTKGTH
jgi:putative resolvase